jgi:hypothetical protein
MAKESFHSFIQSRIEHYGSAQRLAGAIGISLSAFSRGVRLKGSLGVESCLRLAAETGDHPSRVLRLAGKAEVAELIERLYGSRLAVTRISRPERELLGRWGLLKPDDQRFVSDLIEKLGARKNGA